MRNRYISRYTKSMMVESDIRAVDRDVKTPEGYDWKKQIELQGDTEVLLALAGKSLHLPEFEKARVVVVMGEGGLSGTSETGASLGMEREKMVPAVDTFLGISAGATEVLYLSGGHAFKS